MSNETTENDVVDVDVNEATIDQNGNETDVIDAAVEAMNTAEQEADMQNAETDSAAETADMSDSDEAADPVAVALAAAESKASENWDMYVRARAEADNALKRAQREIENARKFAVERFAGDMLAVLDSMEMGLKAATDDADVDTIREGMELTAKQLHSVFERFKIEPIDAVGEKFNPELHEAMTMVPSPEHEPNTVLDVIQQGYTLNGRLLRPARVIVVASA